MPKRPTPAEAWQTLLEGNARFTSGQMAHPSQDAYHRTQISAGQSPFAVLFGCSDSRVAAEIIFDQGLGDLFVVRTAGHVLDMTVIGSIEYGVDILGASLVVVLGHDNCGAIAAATTALTTGQMPRGFVRAVVDRVIPSIVGFGGIAHLGADLDPEALRSEHVRATVRMLQDYSISLANAAAEGRCAIVGVEYALADGAVSLVEAIGAIG